MSDQFQIKTISPVHFLSMAYKSVHLSAQHQKKKAWSLKTSRLQLLIIPLSLSTEMKTYSKFKGKIILEVYENNPQILKDLGVKKKTVEKPDLPLQSLKKHFKQQRSNSFKIK